MDALIVAAGQGKRLGLVGKKNIKCLLNIKKNLKIIDLLLKQLKGIKNLNIVIGYKAKNLKKYLKKKYKKKINFIENKEFYKFGNFYSVLLARNFLRSDFILLNSDIILPKLSIKKLIEDNRKNLVLTNPNFFYNKDDITVKINKNKLIKKIYIKKLIKEKNLLACSGTIKISKKSSKLFFSTLQNLLKKKMYNSYYENAYPHLFKKEKFYAKELENVRLEIDTISDYKYTKNFIKKNKIYD